MVSDRCYKFGILQVALNDKNSNKKQNSCTDWITFSFLCFVFSLLRCQN